jgi:ABC-type lipoprotein export system ATPase subunit
MVTFSDPVIALEGRGIGRVFGRGDLAVRALHPADVAVVRGEVLVIMGPSGSGKTTLLSILGLVLTPTEGDVLVDGRSVGHATADEMAVLRRDRVGFIFQQFNLLPSLSALENAAIPLLLSGVRRADRIARAEAALDLVGMADKRSATPRLLSGGQQQRVAIARALVNEPELILADEPTGNLDSRTAVEIMEILQRLNRERALTVVLITHEPDIAEYAERVVAFRDGRVVRDERIARRRDAAAEMAALPPLEEVR